MVEVRVHPGLSSCNRLLQSSHPPDIRYVLFFWRHLHTEAIHIIRVDREVRIALYISYHYRIAIVSQTLPFVKAALLVSKVTSLLYCTYPFMVYYIYAIESENYFCASIILFIYECLRYRLIVGLMWCVCWSCVSLSICSLKLKRSLPRNFLNLLYLTLPIISHASVYNSTFFFYWRYKPLWVCILQPLQFYYIV